MDVEKAWAVPRSPVSVTITARGHRLVQDKPPASGGGDEGLMASELLLAGLLACQHSTFVRIAAKRRVDVEVERLEGELHFVQGDIARAVVHIHVKGAADDDALATIARLTDGACTISKVLKVPVEVTAVRV